MPREDAEHFTTGDNPPFKDLDTVLGQKLVPELPVKLIVRVTKMLMSSTPGPLGAIKVELVHEAPAHVDLERPQPQA
ncbi:MAG TPA: hypothetical protein VMT54_00875 [Candidatus Cybelea sp.]|nr:hypothetical protein [Candidatus Cybelea sp.]